MLQAVPILRDGHWIYCPAPETFPNEEVPEGLVQFFYGFAVKLTLNLDIVSHSVATVGEIYLLYKRHFQQDIYF